MNFITCVSIRKRGARWRVKFLKCNGWTRAFWASQRQVDRIKGFASHPFLSEYRGRATIFWRDFDGQRFDGMQVEGGVQ